MKINIILSNQFSPKQRAKIESAIEMLDFIVNTDGFDRRVLLYRAPGELGFHYDGHGIPDKSGKDVLTILKAGAESLSPSPDQEMDASIALGTGSQAIGYTYPNSRWQWINKWFLDLTSTKPADIAGNIAHEYAHKLGFDHAYNFHSKRQYTVPYAIGYLVRDMSKYKWPAQ